MNNALYPPLANADVQEAISKGYLTLRPIAKRQRLALHNTYWRWCDEHERIYCELRLAGSCATFHYDAYSTDYRLSQDASDELWTRFTTLWRFVEPTSKQASCGGGSTSGTFTHLPLAHAERFALFLAEFLHATHAAESLKKKAVAGDIDAQIALSTKRHFSPLLGLPIYKVKTKRLRSHGGTEA